MTLGVVHPMRFREERLPVVDRVHRGEERVSHVQGRFFIRRLDNVGATGLQRSWTDNLLWHHTTHLVDFGLWMVSGGDMATADQRIRNIHSAYSPIEPRTGIPMELALIIETHDDQTIVTTGSYYSGEYIYDTLAVTDRDSYRVNERRSTLHTSKGSRTSPPRRRTPNSSPRISSGPSPRAVNRRCPDGRYCPRCGCCTGCSRTGTPNTVPQLIPGRPFL